MIKTIIHSADWQYNESSQRIKDACIYAANNYFDNLTRYSFEYDYNEMLQIIAGDIFDKKEKSSINEFLWIKGFLEKCCEFSETIITVGNHDYDLNNRDNPTLLKLLVENFNIPGLIYYEKSDIYEYNDELRFFVYSNLDHNKKPDNFNEKLKKDKLNIGLYHAPLSNAKDFNPNVKYMKHPSVKIFDGLNCVIMGDIHKRQAIQIDNNTYAVYSGSPYQRTWGEDVDNHGFVKWNLPELSHEFIDLKNPHRLIKIEMDTHTKKINLLN